VASPDRALVVGGGIGGLTAAIALRRVGIQAQVLERAPELREVGAGIGIWANAVRVLDRLGLGDAVRELGGRPLGGAMVTSGGRRLSSQPAAVLQARWGAPTIAVLRSDLQGLLLETLPPDAVRLGAEVAAFRPGRAQVDLALVGGETLSADLVVGADGLRSVVRRQLLGGERPRYRGYTAWRGVAAEGTAHGLDAATEVWGHGERFGLLPGRDDRLIWYASANAPEGGRAPDGERQELLRRFGTWQDPIPATVASMAEDRIVRTDVYDRPVTRRWVSPHLALLGDAAHPMTPDLGQGACQAIVDAWVLADRLRHGRSTDVALAEYARRRWRTAAAAAVIARTLGRVGQWQHPVACRIRDEVMHAIPLTVQLRSLDAVMRVD
jgi:2-polyprenyl-6-methoxyphenol hydroxylase-like FAD-dependent oxidoreductase